MDFINKINKNGSLSDLFNEQEHHASKTAKRRTKNEIKICPSHITTNTSISIQKRKRNIDNNQNDALTEESDSSSFDDSEIETSKEETATNSSRSHNNNNKPKKYKKEYKNQKNDNTFTKIYLKNKYVSLTINNYNYLDPNSKIELLESEINKIKSSTTNNA